MEACTEWLFCLASQNSVREARPHRRVRQRLSHALSCGRAAFVSYSAGSVSRNHCVARSRCASPSGPPPGCSPQRPPTRNRAGGASRSSGGTDFRRRPPGSAWPPISRRCCISFSPEDRGRPLSSASPPSPSCPPLPRDPSPPPGEAQAPQSPSALPGRVRAAPVPWGPWSRRPSAPQHRRGAGPHFAMRVGTPGPSVFSGRPLIARLPCVSPRKGDICSTAVLLLPVLNHDGFIRFFPHPTELRRQQV